MCTCTFTPLDCFGRMNPAVEFPSQLICPTTDADSPTTGGSKPPPAAPPAVVVEILTKAHDPVERMNAALEDCNEVLLMDFGPGHVLRPQDAPDMLVIARKPGSGLAVGLLTLHLHPSPDGRSNAWELGTMSAMRGFRHGQLQDLFLEPEHVPSAIADAHRRDGGQRDAWLVGRVKQENARRIQSFKVRGFEEPEHFLVGVLSDEGYVPFDPFFEVLLKRRVAL
jgi:hypothetical protein